jgi:hypothetical protein
MEPGALELSRFLVLAALGFGAGAIGTLVGAGGGFLIVPALMLLHPEASPAALASTSLAVVFFNAYSGTFAYVRMGRLDGFAATLFAAASVPGAVLAALLVRDVPRGAFDGAFGLLLLAAGLAVLRDPLGRPRPSAPIEPLVSALRDQPGRMRLGAIGSAYISAGASLLGIGGGIVHVPFLVRVLRFPPHLATATSQFVLAVTAFTATVVHVAQGTLSGRLDETLSLAVGVMMGAPVGAALSARLGGAAIVRVLGAALCVVGVRLLMRLW